MVTSSETRRGTTIILLCALVSHGVATETDIFCLKSIKDSLEDSNDYLVSSWNFNNNTAGFICRFNGVECWHPDENRVLNLILSNMGLKGPFPRGIQNCSSLAGLDLSMNEFSGPIPSDIDILLQFATSIDLSSNKFSGEIPASLSNCSYLNALKLDQNLFSGQIPPELVKLPRLKIATFSNNKLSGQVPAFENGLVTVDSYANNMGLCGGPLAPCSSSHNSTIGFLESFKDGLIFGFVFSFLSVVVTYISYCAPWTQQLKLKPRNRNSHNLPSIVAQLMQRNRQRGAANQVLELLPLRMQDKGTQTISALMERLTSTMSFDELNDATDCFLIDNAIGVGKMGIMYKAVLPNCGSQLAVKRLLGSQLFERHILLEIRIPGKFRHRNIAPLLGFCFERNEKILVYEYMLNGRLSKWLHPLPSEDMRLPWHQRTKIALGIARALSWLHHTCDLRISHLNICSECVLLDANFEPKLSNFGEAKFMNPNSHDDLGMAFYVKDGKKDVYDFGNLLFELLTGKTFVELSSLSDSANLYDNPSNFYDVIDESLIGKGFENEIFTLIKVACECVQPFATKRPTMLQVYNNMSNIWEGRHEYGVHSDSEKPRKSEIVADSDGDDITEFEILGQGMECT